MNFLTFAAIPFIMSVRRNQLHERSFFVSKLFMLRGGKVLRVQRESLYGDGFRDWIEVRYINLISEDLTKFEDSEKAEFLNEVG